jgi:hypothetical protein
MEENEEEMTERILEEMLRGIFPFNESITLLPYGMWIVLLHHSRSNQNSNGN